MVKTYLSAKGKKKYFLRLIGTSCLTVCGSQKISPAPPKFEVTSQVRATKTSLVSELGFQLLYLKGITSSQRPNLFNMSVFPPTLNATEVEGRDTEKSHPLPCSLPPPPQSRYSPIKIHVRTSPEPFSSVENSRPRMHAYDFRTLNSV